MRCGRVLAVPVVAVVLAGTGCSSGAGASACPGAPLVGSAERLSAVDGHEARTVGGDEVVDGAAVVSGNTYSVALGTTDVGAGEDLASGPWPTAPAGGAVVTVGVAVPFDPDGRHLEPGQVVAPGVDGSVELVVDTGGGDSGPGVGAAAVEGTVEVLDVDEDRLCLAMDLADDDQRLVGSVEVPLHRDAP